MNRPWPDAWVAILAGGTGLALLLGAWGFQYLGGLPPCEMCIWQRWPHGLAIIVGVGGGVFVLLGDAPRGLGRAIAVVAIASLAVSGLIGIFHAGVEWHWWTGPTDCAGTGFVPGGAIDPSAPLQIVRCDVAMWRLFGLSLAGYNALFSLGVAGASLYFMGRPVSDGKADDGGT